MTFRIAAAQVSQAVEIRAKPGAIGLRRDKRDTPAWTLQGPNPVPRFKRGGALDIALQNDLPAPAALSIRGFDGAAVAEPLLAQSPVAPGGWQNLALPLRQAGTHFCDLWLPDDSTAQPTRPLPLIVEENEAIQVDRDEVLLIEEWRLRADGTAVPPGADPGDSQVFHTINGIVSSDLMGTPVRANERLRFRVINASHRSVVALKLENLDVRVMAIDGAPAEPFSARNGALVLAPGSRTDVFVDMTGPPGQRFSMLLHDGKQARVVQQLVISEAQPIRPTPLPQAAALPANGLPDSLDLKNALRVEFPLEGADWVAPQNFAASSPPAFRAKTGRTVVLALANRGPATTTFHLHGHHFRLLDRLDDGWKPFWLDTLAIEPAQTSRVAFAADYAGRFLLEAVATDWAAPRLLRWYDVG